MAQKKKNKTEPVDKKIIDGKPNNSPFDLSSSMKKEIQDRIDATYNKYVKKDGKK